VRIGFAGLEWPPSLTHTISAVNGTENVYGQKWIVGVTGLAGATPGLAGESSGSARPVSDPATSPDGVLYKSIPRREHRGPRPEGAFRRRPP
jgi:hypothetical protein